MPQREFVENERLACSDARGAHEKSQGVFESFPKQGSPI